MEQQQQTKGIGKESQLSKIAAAVNPGSMAEANPTATQSMISTFMQTFESSALELREETNDDQKELIKTMIDEITKLQTKNMKEFEKAIGKIVGITKDLQNSDNQLLQKLGKDMEEKSREEVVKASGYTLTGEKDTFLNRLGRSVGMNTEEEPVEKTREGIGKLAKGFASNVGGTLKRGFNIAVGREAPEGSFADNVFTSDEQKRERLLSRIDSESNETQTVSANETIKKVIEEYFKEDKQKSESSEKTSKETLTVSSLTEAFKTALDQHFSESKSSTGSFEKNNIESSSDSSTTKSLEELFQESRKESSSSSEDSFQKSRNESSSSSEENSLISTLTDEQKKLYSQFEKLMEEFDQAKSTEELENIVKEINVLNEKFVAAYPSTKSPSVNSDAQEDSAGISKDATIEALQKTADSNVLIQEYSNTTQEKATETVDVLKEILELMKKMSADNQSGGAGGDGGDGGGMDIDLPDRRRGPRRSRGRIRARARMASRGIRGRVGGLARGLVSGARTVGSAILSGGARTIGMLGLGTAGAAGAAGLGAAGTAGLAATGAAGATGLGTAGAAGAAGLGTAGAAGATGLGTAGAAGAAGATGAAAKSTGFLGKIASGASSLGSKASGLLSKAPGLAKGLGFAGRVAGKLALPLAAGMAAYDGYKGFNADPNATTGQKFKNAGRNVLSGLTFGLVDSTEDKMAAGEYTGTQKGAVEKPSGGGFFSRNKGMVAGAALGPAGMVAGAAYDKMSGNKSSNIQPKAKESTGNFFSSNKGAIAGAALGPVGMLAGAAYDKMSSSKAETGKNMDGALIEQGTAATKEKMQINVPPPTVINQGGGGGQAQPQITFPGGVGKVRTDDPTWLVFQKRRAVA